MKYGKENEGYIKSSEGKNDKVGKELGIYMTNGVKSLKSTSFCVIYKGRILNNISGCLLTIWDRYPALYIRKAECWIDIQPRKIQNIRQSVISSPSLILTCSTRVPDSFRGMRGALVGRVALGGLLGHADFLLYGVHEGLAHHLQ